MYYTQLTLYHGLDDILLLQGYCSHMVKTLQLNWLIACSIQLKFLEHEAAGQIL